MVASFPATGNMGEGVRWGKEDKESGEYNFGPAHSGREVQCTVGYAIYPRGEKWAQDRKLTASIGLLLERMSFPVENMKSISISGNRGSRGKTNGQRVGGGAEKPNVTETKQRIC